MLCGGPFGGASVYTLKYLWRVASADNKGVLNAFPSLEEETIAVHIKPLRAAMQVHTYTERLSSLVSLGLITKLSHSGTGVRVRVDGQTRRKPFWKPFSVLKHLSITSNKVCIYCLDM